MNLKKVFSISNIYFFGLLLMIVGLPLSKVLMSMSQMFLGLAWFLEGNYKKRIVAFFKNKTALAVISIFLLHIIGLLYTNNFSYGFNDIRIKLPVLILPFIFATSKPLEEKRFSILLGTYCASIFVATIISIFVLNGIFHKPVHDIRNISIFISHIRFGLLICIAFYCAIYLYNKYKQQLNSLCKVLIVLMAVWYIIFLIILESMTGLSVLAVSGIVLLLYHVFTQKNKIRKAIIILSILAIPSVCYYLVSKSIRNYSFKRVTNVTRLDERTALNNLYTHDTISHQFENGYPIWIYVCEPELKNTWNMRSHISYDSTDIKKQRIRYTIIRFLASKGLRKDAEGVMELSNREILSIENGIANVNYQGLVNITGRINIITAELITYFRGDNPSAHSTSQRFEYWKTAIRIIKQYPIIGVGTGDINDAFQQSYNDNHSLLAPEWRFRSHNQYLSIGVAFGLMGLLCFAFSLLYPLFTNKMQFDFLYITFFMIAVISMLTEDTLETQAGATFFAFFNALFLWGKQRKRES